MFLRTTFWTPEIHHFDHILCVDRDQTIIRRVSFSEHKLKIKQFFKDVAKLSYTEKNPHRQFAVLLDDIITPICWFDLVLDDGSTISRDHAFGTTLIQYNHVVVPFGGVPFWYKNINNSRAKYLYSEKREYKIEKQALIFIANKV